MLLHIELIYSFLQELKNLSWIQTHLSQRLMQNELFGLCVKSEELRSNLGKCLAFKVSTVMCTIYTVISRVRYLM